MKHKYYCKDCGKRKQYKEFAKIDVLYGNICNDCYKKAVDYSEEYDNNEYNKKSED